MGDPDGLRGNFLDRLQQFRPVAMVGDHQWQLYSALLRPLPHHHPAGREGDQRFVEAPCPAFLKGGGRADDDRALEGGGIAFFERRGAQIAEIDALRDVIITQPCQRAVNINGIGITVVAEQTDDALRLAQRIGPDEVGAVGKLFDGDEQLGRFHARQRMMKHRQAEGGLCDEDIARHRLEGRAGGVHAALVVSRGDDAHPVHFHRDLRRTQHMACWMETDGNAVYLHLLAECHRLFAAAEILAITDAHYIQRLARGQHRAMAGAGVVGMTVGDERPRHRADGIDIKITRRAIKALGRGIQQLFRLHIH